MQFLVSEFWPGKSLICITDDVDSVWQIDSTQLGQEIFLIETGYLLYLIQIGAQVFEWKKHATSFHDTQE